MDDPNETFPNEDDDPEDAAVNGSAIETEDDARASDPEAVVEEVSSPEGDDDEPVIPESDIAATSDTPVGEGEVESVLEEGAEAVAEESLDEGAVAEESVEAEIVEESVVEDAGDVESVEVDVVEESPDDDADVEESFDEESTDEEDGGEEESLDEMERRAESEGVPMMELLLREGDYLPERMQRGDLVQGVIVSKDRNQLTVNIGAKQDGVVPSSDIMRLPPGYFDALNAGDSVQAIVLRPENREGEVLVSIHQALTLTDWDDAQALMDSGEIVELEIVGFNKGGALVGLGNLEGFLPRSHLARLGGREQGAAERLAEFIGQKVPVKIIEVERRKRRLIMSERLALREWRSDQKKKLLEELTEGEVRTGRVSSIADFGAFVDLGGADGLIHVSELSYERGKHPRDVVKVGQEVKVFVLHVDHERSRIGLSMKRLIEDPWANVEDRHYVGELAEGTISNLAEFGAFARLEDGLEGLIHISELSDAHVEHPSEVLQVGQVVTVEVISIEPDRQRIGLSIRRVPDQLKTEIADGVDDAADVDASDATDAAEVADEVDVADDVDTGEVVDADTDDDDAVSMDGAADGTELIETDAAESESAVDGPEASEAIDHDVDVESEEIEDGSREAEDERHAASAEEE